MKLVRADGFFLASQRATIRKSAVPNQTFGKPDGGFLIEEKMIEEQNDLGFYKTGEGFLYFVATKSDEERLRNGKSAPVKVGKTGQEKKRIESLQTAHPEKLCYVRLVPFSDVDKAEREAHKHFDNMGKRINVEFRSEWFLLTLNDISEYGNKF